MLFELPKPFEMTANALEIDKEAAEKHIQCLYERTLVTPGKDGWNFATNLVLLKDYIGSANEKYDDDEVFDLAREMSLEDSHEPRQALYCYIPHNMLNIFHFFES